MQCPILVDLACVTFDVRLHLRLHDAADSDYVTTDACVDKIVFNFTLDCLGHFSCVNIINVVLNLLNLQPLIKTRPSRVLLRIENSAAAVDVYASVWRLPLAIDEANNNLWLALVTSELYWLHEDLDWWHSQYGASDADVFVDQVGLYHAHGEDLVEVVEAQYHNPMV